MYSPDDRSFIEDIDEMDPIVVQLAEEYGARLKQGDSPRISEYTHRFPELEKEILQVFPAIDAMQRVAKAVNHDESFGKSLPSSRPNLHEQFKKIGDFNILREIGRGGMGVVYLAEQPRLNRVVALKLLPRSLAENPSLGSRFKREAEAAARLSHPNIVPVFDLACGEGTTSTGETFQVTFYTMQFIDGQSLDEWLKLNQSGRDPINVSELNSDNGRRRNPTEK